MSAMKMRHVLMCLGVGALLASCGKDEMRESEISTQDSYSFWGAHIEAGYDALAADDVAVLAEISLENEFIRSLPGRKVDVEYSGVVTRCLRGNVAPGTRVQVTMTAETTPHDKVNECTKKGIPCFYHADHQKRKAYLYLPKSYAYSVTPEDGLQCEVNPSDTPIFWGAEADKAVLTLFPQSTEQAQ